MPNLTKNKMVPSRKEHSVLGSDFPSNFRKSDGPIFPTDRASSILTPNSGPAISNPNHSFFLLGVEKFQNFAQNIIIFFPVKVLFLFKIRRKIRRYHLGRGVRYCAQIFHRISENRAGSIFPTDRASSILTVNSAPAISNTTPNFFLLRVENFQNFPPKNHHFLPRNFALKNSEVPNYADFTFWRLQNFREIPYFQSKFDFRPGSAIDVLVGAIIFELVPNFGSKSSSALQHVALVQFSRRIPHRRSQTPTLAFSSSESKNLKISHKKSSFSSPKKSYFYAKFDEK